MNKDINTLSYQLLAASCVFARIAEIDYRISEEYRTDILKLIDRGIGGFCTFQGSLEATGVMIAELQARAGDTLLFCADYEHGLPMRLEGGTDFPHAMALGKVNSTELTRKVGQAIAREARAIGVQWNFSPVCDVNSNPKNPIINIRAFGETPNAVIPHVGAMSEGLQSEGVIACAKHFPGHGDTATDSHLSLPTLGHSRERLEGVEFAPFEAAIADGVRSVMVAHLAVPALSKPEDAALPASLNPAIITGILREKMNFQGLIVTDALDMNAITNHYSSGDAAIRAINAGNDVVLLPENPIEAIDALAREAEENPEFAARLRASATRIEAAKEWCRSFPPPEPISLENHGKLALEVARKAVTVDDMRNVLPLQQYGTFAAFAVMQDDNLQPGAEFFHFLSQVVEQDCDFGFLDASISDDEAAALAEQTADAEVIVAAIFVRGRSHTGTVDLPAHISKALNIIANGRQIAAILLGSPYLRSSIQATSYVSTYSDSTASIGAAALALGGKV
ncbi:MAG: hypothetical protein IPM69_06220 [Ignavibacteria bacterium]|nr:hypothetical protein [Ignavibacteria bacterium]